jgi:tRNA (Thr-GGU) A37 N-methylase
VFSTHSPTRPNPIGISVITVKAIDGNRIRFTGVDMLDARPFWTSNPTAGTDTRVEKGRGAVFQYAETPPELFFITS